jgi:hypothetical protein
MVSIWAIFAAVVMPAIVVSQLTCPADTLVCPTNKPVTNSPFELVYSKTVTRSRETPLANLIVGSSKTFLAARHPMELAVFTCLVRLLSARGRFNYAPDEYIAVINTGGAPHVRFRLLLPLSLSRLRGA